MNVVANIMTAIRISRRKHLVGLGLLLIMGLAFFQVNELTMSAGGQWSAIRPMFDSKSEAKRLLVFLSHMSYRCNTTLSGAGNSSVWPICMDAASSEVPRKRVSYTVGKWSDYTLESYLAHNSSYTVHIISSKPPKIHWPKTSVAKLNIVPNDPADYARNSYNRRTMNDLWGVGSKGGRGGGESRVDILRLSAKLSEGVEAWELLILMIKDHLLNRVDVLQMEFFVDRLDYDYLFNWYRTIHSLFTHSRLALYHTATTDDRCLRVTLMQSCVFMLSFVRISNGDHNYGDVTNPLLASAGIAGIKFALQPPAGFGSDVEEGSRLKEYLNSLQTDCEVKRLGGGTGSGGGGKELRWGEGSPVAPQWDICHTRLHQSCRVIRIKLSEEQSVEEELSSQYGCSVTTYLLQTNSYRVTPAVKKYHRNVTNSFTGVLESEDDLSNTQQTSLTFRLLERLPNQRSGAGKGMLVGEEELIRMMGSQSPVSLVEVEAPQYEWIILRLLMDNHVLENVTQLITRINSVEDILYTTSKSWSRQLLSHYSELRRIESFGLSLFSSSMTSTSPSHYSIQSNSPPHGANQPIDEQYSLGYVRTRYL